MSLIGFDFNNATRARGVLHSSEFVGGGSRDRLTSPTRLPAEALQQIIQYIKHASWPQSQLRLSLLQLKSNAVSLTMVYNFKVFKKCAPNGKLTLYMAKRDFVDHISFVEPIDGVVLLDEEYVRGRKVFGQVVCTFRYGREEDEVMGLSFYKELFLASEQIYPPPEKRSYDLTRTQVTSVFAFLLLLQLMIMLGISH